VTSARDGTKEKKAMIAVRSVTRTYGSGAAAVRALRGVSFDVRAGEIAAVKGRSGSGKTTLLNIVGGLDRPDSGQVAVDGAELTAMSRADLAQVRRETLAFIFQSYALIPILTAAENVSVPMRLTRTDPAVRDDRALMLLRMVGLGEHAHQRCRIAKESPFWWRRTTRPCWRSPTGCSRSPMAPSRRSLADS
jgi:putative ABC transport system ATP-binding protein